MKKLFLVCIAAIVCAIVCITVETNLNALPCIMSASFSPTSYDFGSLAVGETSSETSVTISITGNSVCGVGDMWTGFTLSLTGADAGQFSVTPVSNCSSPEIGSSCTATIKFSPTAAGEYTDAALQAGSASYTMALSGIGTEPVAGSSSTAILLSSLLNKDDSDGCSATASTGAAGKRGFGPTALGLVALMGLVLGTAAVRRRMRKK